MFSAPKAPFFNWGAHVEFPAIPVDEFTSYLNARFAAHGLTLPDDVSQTLQVAMQRNPEAINRISAEIVRHMGSRTDVKSIARITWTDVEEAISSVVGSRRSAAEEYLRRFSPGEERVMVAMAKMGGSVVEPMGKEFVHTCRLSTGGMRKIVGWLEDEAAIYRDGKSYLLADPLIRLHLAAYRL